jgi:biopolymer transport protein TolR
MALPTSSGSPETMSEINVTPLVDVMLVLMVVFLVTAPLLTQSVKVDLPRTAATEANGKDQPLRLGIDARGTVSLNQRPLATPEELETLLKAELQRDGEVGVHLYADRGVPYLHVAKAVTAVQRAGIARLSFVTVEE